MLNPILKKELQLLKGPIIAGVTTSICIILLSISVNPLFLPNALWGVLALTLLLSYAVTASFGHEIENHSMSVWLSHPMTRNDLFKIKLKSLLSVYIGLVIVMSLSILSMDLASSSDGTNNIGWIMPSVIVGAFGPGIFCALKFRNATAAFWLTPVFLLTVMLLTEWIIFSALFPDGSIWNPEDLFLARITMVIIGFIYGATGIWAAKRTFIEWEELGETSSFIRLRFKRQLKHSDSKVVKKFSKTSWFRAIFVREMRLQQLNIFIGISLWIAVWVINKWHHSLLGLDQNQFTKLVDQLPAALRYILFLLPFSIAAVSLADVRRQDVHTWELMLPVSRTAQFVFKASFCLFLGWLFAAGLPFTYDKTVAFSNFWPNQGIALGVISMAAITVSGFSLYISSLTSSFLKSFSVSLGLIPLMILFLAFIHNLEAGKDGYYPLGWFAVSTLLAFIISICAVGWCRHNFKAPTILMHHKLDNWKRWGWGATVIALWFGIMTDRSWERITISEPPPSKEIFKGSMSWVGSIDSANSMDDWQKNHLLHTRSPVKTKIIQESPDFVLSYYNYTVTPFLGDILGGQATIITSAGKLHTIPSSLITGYNGHLHNKNPSNPIAHPTTIPACQIGSTIHKRYLLDIHGKIWSANRTATSSNEFRFEPFSPEEIRFRSLQCSMGVVAALDESNHLWVAEHETENNKYTGAISEFEIIQQSHTWKDIWARGRSILGLKNDGSLWVIRGKYSSLTMMQGSENWDGELIRLASDRSWKSMNWKKNYVLLEAEDRSLWTDQTTFDFSINGSIRHFWSKEQTLIKLQIPDLQQLETSVSHPTGEGYYFTKNDGTLWNGRGAFENLPTSKEETFDQSPIFSIQDEKQIGKRNDWVSLYLYGGMTADNKIWNWDQPQLNRWNPFPARFRHKVVAELTP